MEIMNNSELKVSETAQPVEKDFDYAAHEKMEYNRHWLLFKIIYVVEPCVKCIDCFICAPICLVKRSLKESDNGLVEQ